MIFFFGKETNPMSNSRLINLKNEYTYISFSLQKYTYIYYFYRWVSEYMFIMYESHAIETLPKTGRCNKHHDSLIYEAK